MCNADIVNANKQLVEVLTGRLKRDQTLPPSTGKKTISPAQMLDNAIANDVFYPAYKRLGQYFPKDKASKRRYEQLFYQYITGQSIQRAQASNILRIFTEEGIAVMPLKGLLLSNRYYKDPLTRYARDLDLLFRSKEDRRSAERVLLQAGYSATVALPLQTLFTKHISRFSVHCETHIAPISLTFAFEYPPWHDLWSSSQSSRLLGAKVQVMRPEDAFLILCAHVIAKGTITIRDFLDFVQILRKLNSTAWAHFEQVSRVQIWRYIIALPLVLFCAIGEVLLSRELVSRARVISLAAETKIRVEDSSKLVAFLLAERGMPIDLRDVMNYFGYSRTPLFEPFLLWNKGREFSLPERVKSLFLEGYQSLAIARSGLRQGYAKNCVESYLQTHLVHFRRYYRQFTTEPTNASSTWQSEL